MPASAGLLTRVSRAALHLVGARRSASIQPGQYTGYSLSSPVLSGIVVTPQTALTLTAVYSAINVLSTDRAKLPFGLYRSTPGGGRKHLKRDPRNRLVSVKPNPEMNGMRYRQMEMGHTLGWGNQYSEIVRDGQGMPTALWPLNPGTTKPFRDEQTKSLYYKDTNTGKKFLPENILHIAGLSFDGIMGYSPVTMARQAIGLGIAAEQFGAALFGNGAIPKGILQTPKRLSEIAVKRLRESWELIHGGSQNAHRTAILEEGTTWTSTQINPDDAQFLATRQFQVVEIARLFNMPPHKIGDYSESHLANLEEANTDYVINTLMGWLCCIEAEYNQKLLFEDEQDRLHFHHDVNALLRGNMTARSTFYRELKTVGVVNADTIAAREGLPIPGKENGGNLYLVQSQNIPQQNAGKPQPKPAPEPKIPSVKADSNAPQEPVDDDEESDES